MKKRFIDFGDHMEGRVRVYSYVGENQGSFSSASLATELENWLQKVIAEANFNPNNNFWNLVGYFALEISKNAFEWGCGNNTLSISFLSGKVVVTCDDDGRNQNQIQIKPGHGLDELEKWADKLTIIPKRTGGYTVQFEKAIP